NGESDLGDGSGTAQRFADTYSQAFRDSGINDADDIDANQFLYLAGNNSLDGVNNLYMNIGWTFPAMTTEMTFSLINFMDAGGNLFLAGQDVAWDISENLGNPSTRLFLSGYLKAAYVDDGNAANNPVSGAEDGIFSDFEDFTLFDYYGGGNFYPDQVAPSGGSSPAFVYNGDESRIGGVYFDSGVYKMVYMGFGLEMVQDAAVRADLMKRVHDYFEGLVNNEETASLARTVRIFPNPVQGGNLNIEVKLESGNQLQLVLTDATGRTVRNVEINSNGLSTIDVSGLSTGVYFLKEADGIDQGSLPVQILGE
ncbi:MAG TPA: T9SS type A sorting domain-containing protein, partial [Saprospiraceae bacterium]|nr:T9SS type A sorting domain-containing protein [Saprospiraceae bacterium]